MNIEIHGHRGASGRRPENTLAAVEYALENAVDGVEVDLCVTADDVIVLHHDLRLNPATTRDSNGKWINHKIPIRDLRLNELRQYDVGRINPKYATKFPRQTPVDGARIPTLDEFVELIRQRGKTNTILNLELKGNPPQPALAPAPEHYVSLLLNKLEQLQLSEHVFLQSFDWRLLRPIKQQRPDLKTGLLTNLQPIDPLQKTPPRQFHLAGTPPISILATDWHLYYASPPEMVAKNGGDVWSSYYRDLSEAWVREAHDLGLEVYAWTVNEKQDIEKMAGWGVDAITTDYPEWCRGLI